MATPTPRTESIYQILVAEIAGKRDRLDVALEHYRKVALANRDPSLIERATMLALITKQHVAALELAQRWYVVAPTNEAARQALALSLLRNGQVDEAISHLELIRKATGNRDQQEGFTAVVALLGQVEDKHVALHVLEQFSERQPRSVFAQYYRGMFAAAAGDQEHALASLNRALAQAPKLVQAHLLRARILVERGDRDGALFDLAKAVSDVPRDRNLRTTYVRLLVESGQLEKARREFSTLMQQTPKDSEALYTLGLLAAEVRLFDFAESCFLDLMRRKVRLADVYFEMGRLEEQRGNLTKSSEWYDRVAGGQRAITAQLRKGVVLAKAGEVIALSQYFETLRRRQPENSIPFYLAEADALREADRHQEAFDVLERGLSVHANDKELLYARALLAERVDKLDVMERDLRLLIEQDPKNGQALNALGYTLADRTDRYQEALGYIERALVLLPNDAAVLDSMGWIQYRLGNPAKALESLRKAYQINADAEIAGHFAEVLWVMDQKEEAQHIWRAAQAKQPGHPLLRKLQERFGW